MPGITDSYDSSSRYIRLGSSGETTILDRNGQEHFIAYASGRTLIQTFNPDGFIRTQGGVVQIGASVISAYNSLSLTAQALAVIVGFDHVNGDPRIITVVDPSPITIYTTPTPAVTDFLLRLNFSLNITAYTSGTVTYTITWTKPDGNVASLSITGAALNAEAHQTLMVLVKANTPVTVQATGPFVATAHVSAIVEQLL